MFHNTNSLGSLGPSAEPACADTIPPTAETQQERPWLVGAGVVHSSGTARPGGILRSHAVQPLPEDELCLKHCQCLKSSLFNFYFKTCVNDFIMFSGNVLQGFAKLPSGLFSPNA